MKYLYSTLLALALPAIAAAEGIVVKDAYIPVAPPGSMVHAAYMTITNKGSEPRDLVSVTAEGYHMAHLHMTMEQDGVASMAPMHLVSIAPGQQMTFSPGAMHVMLMKPMQAFEEGSAVNLALSFANGEILPIVATVKRHDYGS